ncbi:MAG: hypothetical protein A3E78_00275 [Alphaproteobacteria bacterium RIFCSPHIGHO2_12_FULL_63_12]|nr:MAG: hypothetical protein A3E78_00275 [Alphaproteobacteria bacterium RIFCSPHIGHO2_12_FULL_63_12]
MRKRLTCFSLNRKDQTPEFSALEQPPPLQAVRRAALLGVAQERQRRLYMGETRLSSLFHHFQMREIGL